MIRTPSLAAFLAACSIASAPQVNAQGTSLVVPSVATDTEQNASMFWFLSPFATRQQFLVDASALRGFEGRRILSIQVRRSAGSQEELGAGHLHLSLSFAQGVAPAQAQALFSANRKSALTQAFSGHVYLPKVPASPRAPAAWQRPFAAEFQLQAPFRYTGGALLVESVTKPWTQGQQIRETPWWPIDARRDPALNGSARSIGASCIPGFAPEAASAESFALHVGGSTRHSLFGTAGTAGLAVFALGVQQTTISLKNFGAPGCEAYTLADAFVPAVFDVLPPGRHAQATLSWTIPNSGSLVGARFFTQWLVPTPSVNVLGWTTSNGVECTLSAGRQTQHAMVIADGTAAMSGQVRFDRVPVVRIHFAPN